MLGLLFRKYSNNNNNHSSITNNKKKKSSNNKKKSKSSSSKRNSATLSSSSNNIKLKIGSPQLVSNLNDTNTQKILITKFKSPSRIDILTDDNQDVRDLKDPFEEFNKKFNLIDVQNDDNNKPLIQNLDYNNKNIKSTVLSTSKNNNLNIHSPLTPTTIVSQSTNKTANQLLLNNSDSLFSPTSTAISSFAHNLQYNTSKIFHTRTNTLFSVGSDDSYTTTTKQQNNHNISIISNIDTTVNDDDENDKSNSRTLDPLNNGSDQHFSSTMDLLSSINNVEEIKDDKNGQKQLVRKLSCPKLSIMKSKNELNKTKVNKEITKHESTDFNEYVDNLFDSKSTNNSHRHVKFNSIYNSIKLKNESISSSSYNPQILQQNQSSSNSSTFSSALSHNRSLSSNNRQSMDLKRKIPESWKIELDNDKYELLDEKAIASPLDWKFIEA